MMTKLRILGYGKALAQKPMTNDDLSKMVDTNDEWIYSRTGIKSRYVTIDENTSDLGYRAACMAIDDAKINANELDIIIVATMTPDKFTPSVASMIQARLGIENANIYAFDINCACSGFIFALKIAAKLLESGQKALVIGAETLSKIINWQDRTTCVLFGDGAGAMIVSADENAQSATFYLHTINDDQQVLFANGISLDSAEQRYGNIQMKGQEVFKFAINAMSEAIIKVLEEDDITLDDISLIIPHQANLRIIKAVAKKMNIDLDKFYINLEKYGNTSAASIPLALADANDQQMLGNNKKIIMVGFGAGLSYGACLLQI